MNEIELFSVVYPADRSVAPTLTPLQFNPKEFTYKKKERAGTTFEFRYPNAFQRARSVFQERRTIVRAVIDGAGSFFEGIVYSVSADPEAVIACVDPFTFLEEETITDDEENGYIGWNIAGVIADLLTTLGSTLWYFRERVLSTQPAIELPREWECKTESKKSFFDRLVKYVNDEALKHLGYENEYFFGFIDGVFRFELLDSVDDTPATFELYANENLFEEVPTFFFDRLVNSATAVPSDSSLDISATYTDAFSVSTFGARFPDKPLIVETTSELELYEAAKTAVIAGKSLTVGTTLRIPGGHFITPGIDVIDIVDSAYGIKGRARVTQVQGSVGSGGTAKLSLGPIPLDDIEVIRKVVG